MEGCDQLHLAPVGVGDMAGNRATALTCGLLHKGFKSVCAGTVHKIEVG